MHRLLACLLALLFFGPLVACEGEDPITGPVRMPIIGGVLDPGDPSVILLYAKNTSTNEGWLCTAEVIAPHVVLTAAHCLGNSKSPVTYRLFLGNDLNNAEQRKDAANWRNVLEAHRHPLFNEKTLVGGHDVGIVIASDTLPLTPLPINRFPMAENLIGKDIRLVGYGKTDGQDFDGVTAGTKRMTNTTLTHYDINLLFLGDSMHNTCQGDSGGPAFMTFNGIEVIAGVTSYGPSGCASGGALTRVDAYTDWIDPFIVKHDPTYQSPDLGPPPPPPDFWRAPDMAPRPTDMPKMDGCTVAGSAQAAPIALAVGLLLSAGLFARRRARHHN